MKKKSIIMLSLLIILLTVICACNSQIPVPSDSGTGTATSDDTRIKELEDKILLLMQNQQLSDNERKKEIASLEAEIKKLKETDGNPTDTPIDTETTEPQIFKYTLENGKAVITSINSHEESITIPSVIDGYQVYSIGSEALSSSTVKSITVSDGIEKLDWFAFRNCIALTSISIPNSISSIGYGAFDNTSRALTIYCSRDSFAHKYAQSYGLTYDIT